MNTRGIIKRLNDLDNRVCSAFGITPSPESTTLDAAIAMSAATTERMVSGQRRVFDAVSADGESLLTDFVQAQVEARQMRAGDHVDVVRSLTAGIRRMKNA